MYIGFQIQVIILNLVSMNQSSRINTSKKFPPLLESKDLEKTLMTNILPSQQVGGCLWDLEDILSEPSASYLNNKAILTTWNPPRCSFQLALKNKEKVPLV